MRDKEFVYKNHQCKIELDVEPEECIKAFHFVTLPEGDKVLADISPYDWSEQTVRMWIDAGRPARVSAGPLSREDLSTMLEKEKC